MEPRAANLDQHPTRLTVDFIDYFIGIEVKVISTIICKLVGSNFFDSHQIDYC
jgi:hypothetical protein